MSRADDQGGHAAHFDHVRDETDGLMAEGSVGDEHGEVDARFCKLVGKRRCKLVLALFMPANTAHERKVQRRQRTDRSILN